MSYISLHKSHLLDSLENQVLYADLCSVIIGEAGIGKSYFLHQLTQRLDRQVYLSQIQAVADLTVEQLEKSISLQLGLSWQGNTDLVSLIKERFDKRALVTIDDAHLLSSTCLEFLMLLVSEQLANKDTHLFIVLAGNAELAKKLSHTSALANNPNICVVFELEPIKNTEVKHLVAEFQEVDVGTIEALYDEQKLDYFWQLSKGIPAEIDYQLKRWLDESSLKTEEKQPPSKSKNYLLAAGYTVIAIVLISVLIFQNELNQMIAEKPNIEDVNGKSTIDKVTESKLPEQTDQTELEQPQEKSSQNLADNSESLEQTKPKTKNNNSQPKLAEQSDDVKQQAVNEEPVNKAVEEPRDEIGELIKSLPSNNQVTQVNPVEQKVNQNSSNDKVQVAKISTPQTQSKTEPPPADKLAQLTQDEELLMAFQDSQFTLQWVGLSSAESANNFRQTHPLKEQMYIFRRKQTKGTLFLVVSGQFNSRDDADHARIIYQRRKYPGKPWIKSAKSVKKDISSQ